LVRQLLEKWFGLDPIPCATCEVLREPLANSELERRELLHKLLDKDKAEPPAAAGAEEMKPIQPQFIPWRVRQQMLEGEDRQRAKLTADKKREIESLEKELGIASEKR
jgi:hypothetical protein